MTTKAAQQQRAYDAILSTSPDLMYVFDLEHRFSYANKALLTMWGKTWEEAIGKTCLELGYEPWHAQMHDREIDEVVATKMSIRGEVPFNGTNGKRIYDYIFVPVLNSEGEVEAVAGTTRDVTENKQRAERSIVLAQLDKSLQGFNTTAEIAHKTAQIIGMQLNGIRAGYGRVSADGNSVKIETDWVQDGQKSAAGVHHFRDYGSFIDKLLQGEMVVVSDINENAETREKIDKLQSLNITSLLNFPLMENDKLAAIIYIHDDKPRVWQSSEIEFMHEIAVRTWAIAERVQAEQAQRDSEERYRLLSEMSSPQVTWAADAQGMLTYASGQWLDYSGMTIADTLGAGWSAAIHPEQFNEILSAWQHSIATGDSYYVEMRLRNAEGVYRWFDARANPIRSAEGAIIEWRGMLLDMEDRKRAVDALRDSEEFTRSIIDNSPDCIKVLDLEGKLLSMNAGGCIQMEIDDVSLCISHEWLSFWSPEYVNDARIAFEGAKLGNVGHFEGFCATLKGTPKWWEVIVTPIRDSADNVVKILVLSRDITQRYYTQKALLEARDAANAANIAKTEFLANMSHEIRTPMNAVIGLANILGMSKPLTEKQEKFIKTLQTSADSLLALINDMLDIAKIEARTVELEEVSFSIGDMVGDVMAMMGEQAKQKNISLTLDAQCAEGRTFLGDPTRLRQIMLNLCSNAVKFTEKGGVHIEVSCSPTDQEGSELLCFAVSDTGIGIAPDHLDSIFQKFVQADSSINRKYGGTGLGLAITKTLAEVMGGNMEVKSELGKGSTFTFCLPLKLAPGQAELAVNDEVCNACVEHEQEMRKILLVEDYAPNVIVATSFIEQFGYGYEVASNGIEALEKITSSAPFLLILMDVQMHGMNGLDTTRLIREHERSHHLNRIPIIGMTAHALTGDRERCLASGMDDYLSKPFNPVELEAKIRSLTEGSKKQSA